MATTTTTIRLNEQDERILKELKEHFGCKGSTVIKKALYELYEDIKDLEEIEKFEEKEKKGEIKWISGEEILKGWNMEKKKDTQGFSSRMDGKKLTNIKPGTHVKVVQKQDQRLGKLTEGIVKDVLTNSQTHPNGIKVRLESGIVGRVKDISTLDS